METRDIIYLSSEQQRCWLDWADVQADLHICCSRMAKTGFLMTWLIYKYQLRLFTNRMIYMFIFLLDLVMVSICKKMNQTEAKILDSIICIVSKAGITI